jgi:hypothetical protein
MTKSQLRLRRLENEAYKDFKYQKFKGIYEKGRLWRMPDLMSVSMQDIMHGWQSEL